MKRAVDDLLQALGVRPEIEVFDTGHLVLCKQLIREGLIDDPVMIQLCMGIPYGAPDDPQTLMAMVILVIPALAAEGPLPPKQAAASIKLPVAARLSRSSCSDLSTAPWTAKTDAPAAPPATTAAATAGAAAPPLATVIPAAARAATA